jgi:hypothetical protein
MKLVARLARLLRPDDERPDHPLTARERVEEATHSEHVWTEAQNIGGANSWGRVDVEPDFEGR